MISRFEPLLEYGSSAAWPVGDRGDFDGATPVDMWIVTAGWSNPDPAGGIHVFAAFPGVIRSRMIHPVSIDGIMVNGVAPEGETTETAIGDGDPQHVVRHLVEQILKHETNPGDWPIDGVRTLAQGVALATAGE